jgi:CRISPR-associated protein Csx17
MQETVTDSIAETPHPEPGSALQTIPLPGCSPTPLAHYLKALGVLRLVSEQADPSARGRWTDDGFELRSALDRDALVEFFLRDYAPTPILAPWNGGSGFRADKTPAEHQAVLDSGAERFDALQRTMEQIYALMGEMGFSKKVTKKRKDDFLRACRARLPDEMLDWLDAALVLTEDRVNYPPLLGTGGNDGRLDFTRNFLRRLPDLFDVAMGEPLHIAGVWLESALFEENHNGLARKAAIGQFFPQAVGGPNAESGFEADTVSNPWDFLLMLEGATFFATAAVKRLESSQSSRASAPFCVRHVGVGFASADDSDEESARAELWMPLWGEPASARELRQLMSEGRIQVGRRPARDGLDVARAIATLGVDRGIESFQRFGFHERNGRAYFATPLNRIDVERKPRVDLVQEIDRWLDRLGRHSRGDNAPASVRRAARSLEEAIFDLCQVDDSLRVRRVLLSLGACERALGKSLKWTMGGGSGPVRVSPVPYLSPRWLGESYDDSAEYRLAASLASVYARYGDRGASIVPIREQVEPVRAGRRGRHRRPRWREEAGRQVVWHDGSLVEAMNAVMRRRIIEVEKAGLSSWPDRGSVPPRLEDIAAFIEGRIDAQRMKSIFEALILIDWREVHGGAVPWSLPSSSDAHPGALYALMKLCFPVPNSGIFPGDRIIPLEPHIHRHASRGDGLRASKRAVRRLRGSGLRPDLEQLHARGDLVERAAAALLFPVGKKDIDYLRRLVEPRRESQREEPEE